MVATSKLSTIVLRILVAVVAVVVLALAIVVVVVVVAVVVVKDSGTIRSHELVYRAVLDSCLKFVFFFSVAWLLIVAMHVFIYRAMFGCVCLYAFFNMLFQHFIL